MLSIGRLTLVDADPTAIRPSISIPIGLATVTFKLLVHMVGSRVVGSMVDGSVVGVDRSNTLNSTQ